MILGWKNKHRMMAVLLKVIYLQIQFDSNKNSSDVLYKNRGEN